MYVAIYVLYVCKILQKLRLADSYRELISYKLKKQVDFHLSGTCLIFVGPVTYAFNNYSLWLPMLVQVFQFLLLA